MALASGAERRRHLVAWARASRQAIAAEEAAARLAAETPDEADEPAFTVELGECLVAAGRPADAAAALGKLAARRPDDPALRLGLGAALLAAGQPAGPLPHLEAAWSRGRTPRAAALYAEALLRAGTLAVAAGELAAGEKQLARAVEVDATQAALVNLGIARLALGDARAALAPLEKAARPGEDPVAMQLYARALAQSGGASGAVQVVEAALPLVAGDAGRTLELVLEAAAAEVDAGEPGRAVARLEAAAPRVPAAERARLAAAYGPAARAAAREAMTAGNFGEAVRLLERAVDRAGRGDAATAARCELALAATGAANPELALETLERLGNARCPFKPPADELTVPILHAANTGPDDRRVDAALARLAALDGRATGPAARLLADATRWLALRAAAAAHAAGRPDRARRYLAAAPPDAGPERAYDLAVLDLEAGDVDGALRALERVAADVPEALVALGIAYDRKGDAARALEHWRRARDRGARVAGLSEWIEAKERIHGEAP